MTSRPVEDRYWSKVQRTETCWLWTASTNRAGYGQFAWRRSDGTYTMRQAHGVAYEWLVGAVPSGLELDHLCRVRACVNPAHLEPVTHLENIRRGEWAKKAGAWQRALTHCKQGHPYDEANTLLAGGQRMCRECRKKWKAISAERAKARRQSAA